jgi:hypothetical protein
MENIPLFSVVFQNQKAKSEITGMYSSYFIQIDEPCKIKGMYSR